MISDVILRYENVKIKEMLTEFPFLKLLYVIITHSRKRVLLY